MLLRVCVLGLVTQARLGHALLESDGPGTLLPKIAVVGGGIGGTSAAFFLHDVFKGTALVDVYEPGHIGGRLAILPIAGHLYEVGGSVIHPRNHYMMEFAARFKLPHKEGCDARMGLYDGQQFVYRDSPWTVLTLGRLFWRYGLSALRLVRLIENMFLKFERVYQLQAEGRAYKDVASLLAAMDPQFPEMAQMSTADWLRAQGLSQLMVDELVTAITQTNYGQTPSIQAFVGAVSVAAADPNLWSVLGGNKRVAEALLKESRASHLTRTVTQVAPTDDGRFMVSSVEAETADNQLFTVGSSTPTLEPDLPPTEEPRTQDYDIVIIAAPLTSDKTNLKLANFTHKFSFPGRYERIVCTMVQGELCLEALNLDKGDEIKEILVSNPNLFFNSIGLQHPADANGCLDELAVWKIFSPVPLTEVQMDAFFPRRSSVNEIDWLAYPHYESNQSMGNFELTPGLYNINAIEWAGSAMEMSIIGGKNTALLAYKYWMKDPDAGGQEQRRDEL